MPIQLETVTDSLNLMQSVVEIGIKGRIFSENLIFDQRIIKRQSYELNPITNTLSFTDFNVSLKVRFGAAANVIIFSQTVIFVRVHFRDISQGITFSQKINLDNSNIPALITEEDGTILIIDGPSTQLVKLEVSYETISILTVTAIYKNQSEKPFVLLRDSEGNNLDCFAPIVAVR